MNLIAPLRHAFRRRVVSGRVPDIFRRRYPALYEAPVEPMPDGGACFDRARLWRRGGIRVLRVAGDRFEMAFQHGRLLSGEIARGTLRQASLITRNAIRNSCGNGLLARLLYWYADRCISEPILRRGLAYQGGSPTRDLGDTYGLSESCGVPVWTILRAAVGPETAQVLLGLTQAKVAGGHLQCSSFAAWGSATLDGEMIIGRNTDYPLNGCYDAYPTVVYFEPTDGAHRYMTITSAGFHIAGVCGMNEHGLFVGVHSVPASTVSELGVPVFLVGQEILRRAATLDEAAALLEMVRPAAGWNYHVVSTRERRALTLELCNAAAAMRPCRGDVHITTNHWTQPAMLPHQLTAISTFMEDSNARAERVRVLIDAAGGALDAAGAAAILGDSIDPVTGKARCFPNVLAATHNVSSSVWRPDTNTVYVAVGCAPTSRGPFLALPTPEALDPEALTLGPIELLQAASHGDGTPGLDEARQWVIAARIAFEYHNDANAAADLMACAAARFDDPALDLAWALMEIRAGRLDRAWEPVKLAINQDCDPRRSVIARYLRGRLAADRGNAGTARTDFQAVQNSEHADDRLITAARTAERKLGRRTRLRLQATEIIPIGWLPDAFRYLGLH
jgi:hypothetical protein